MKYIIAILLALGSFVGLADAHGPGRYSPRRYYRPHYGFYYHPGYGYGGYYSPPRPPRGWHYRHGGYYGWYR
jgi:hypothetical protein